MLLDTCIGLSFKEGKIHFVHYIYLEKSVLRNLSEANLEKLHQVGILASLKIDQEEREAVLGVVILDQDLEIIMNQDTILDPREIDMMRGLGTREDPDPELLHVSIGKMMIIMEVAVEVAGEGLEIAPLILDLAIQVIIWEAIVAEVDDLWIVEDLILEIDTADDLF